MATQLFLLSAKSDSHRGDNTARLAGGTGGWDPLALGTARGGGVVGSANTATVTGPTSGIEIDTTSSKAEWISPPLAADVTISGAVTCNVWAAENNMSANVAINFVVDKIDGADESIVEVVRSARTTEVAVTTRAVNNFTATPAAGVAFKRGDRIRVRIYGDDAGTMATGFTFNIGYNGTTAAADGDSYVTFTETFSFETAPSGSVLYLTDTASDINPGSIVSKEAWTSRGSGSVNAIRNTLTGWFTISQITSTGGGTLIEWYSKPLTAFTLGGICQFNIRALESNLAANASLAATVAVVNNDGSGAVQIGRAHIPGTLAGQLGEITGSDAAYVVNVGTDDVALTDGQRLRFRIYIDDCADVPLVTGHTVTVTYSGTSAAAAGDTYVTLPQSVSEFTAGDTSLIAGLFDRRTPRRRIIYR